MTKKKTSTKPPNPYSRLNPVQARLTTEEFSDALTKAAMYHGGEMSETIRAALKAYKPLKKKAVDKL